MVSIQDVRLDFCIACPTGKKAVATYRGDTISATFRFYSRKEYDSLTMISIEHTSSILQHPIGKRNVDANVSPASDLNGRKIAKPSAFQIRVSH